MAAVCRDCSRFNASSSRWSLSRSSSASLTSATVAAAAASVRGYCCTIFASDLRALSVRPAFMSRLACFISAAASRSFGTVRTRYAATPPRIADTIAVKRRSVRTFMARLLLPAEFSDERHELRRSAVFDAPLRADARHAREPLRSAFADRHDELARSFQLLQQRLRNLGSRGGDDDSIERRLIRPSVCSVEHLRRHVVDLQLADQFRGAKRQLVDAFDGKDFRTQL